MIPLVVIFLDVLALIFSIVLSIILGGDSGEGLSAILFASFAMMGAGAILIALIIGIAGACQKNRKKLFAVLGIILNSLFLLVLAGLMVIFSSS